MTGKLKTFRSLNLMASSALFCLSYLPLFILMIGKAVIFHYQYLHFCGISANGVKVFLRCFSIPTLCVLASIWGILGSYNLVQNLEKRRSSRVPIKLETVENQGSEALTYLVSYALPLLQTSGNVWMDAFTFLVIIAIYFGLYINSKLMLVNPILNLFFRLYQISFTRLDLADNSIVGQGWAICKQPHLTPGDKIMALDVGNNLFYLND